jgi:hypothetical protein
VEDLDGYGQEVIRQGFVTAVCRGNRPVSVRPAVCLHLLFWSACRLPAGAGLPWICASSASRGRARGCAAAARMRRRADRADAPGLAAVPAGPPVMRPGGRITVSGRTFPGPPLRRIAAALGQHHRQRALAGGFAVPARAGPRFTRDVDAAVMASDAGGVALVRSLPAGGPVAGPGRARPDGAAGDRAAQFSPRRQRHRGGFCYSPARGIDPEITPGREADRDRARAEPADRCHRPPHRLQAARQG